MSTPFDNKILLVVWKTSQLPSPDIAQTAQFIKANLPNVAGIMIKVLDRTNWQGFSDTIINAAGNRVQAPNAITGPASIRRWVDGFAQFGLEVHLWGVPVGINVREEADLYIQAGNVPGVKSVSIDIEHGKRPDGSPLYWKWENDPTPGRVFSQRMRNGLPNQHLSIIADYRNNRPFSVYFDPFIPFMDSIQPMVYPHEMTFIPIRRPGNAPWNETRMKAQIDRMLTDARTKFAPHGKPIIPMLQTHTAFNNVKPRPGEVTYQGEKARAMGFPGITYFRMGEDGPLGGHMNSADYAAIAKITGTFVGDFDPGNILPFSLQDVINAFATVASDNDQPYGTWLDNTGLTPHILSGAPRDAAYTGPALTTLPNISETDRNRIIDLLNTKSSAELRTLATAAQEAFSERQAAAENKLTGSVIGVHGALAAIAPPADTWEMWLKHLTEMGIKWYVQWDNGSADQSSGSVFQWVLALKRAGIEPIIRYKQEKQYPQRLSDAFFTKMQAYVQHDIRWCEIGGEMNNIANWELRQFPNVDFRNPNTMQTLASNWIADAERAIQIGAKPALYSVDPVDREPSGDLFARSSVGFMSALLAALAAQHRIRTIDVFRKGAWLATESATYDTPLADSPMETTATNFVDKNFRNYEIYQHLMQQHLGIQPADVVVMATQGGVYLPKSAMMASHRAVSTEAAHATQTLDMFAYAERETRLQAVCGFCLSVGTRIGAPNPRFEGDSWIQEIQDSRVGVRLRPRPVVNALKALKTERDNG